MYHTNARCKKEKWGRELYQNSLYCSLLPQNIIINLKIQKKGQNKSKIIYFNDIYACYKYDTNVSLTFPLANQIKSP